MSWVTVLWSMIASACLTLALVHGLVWWRHREAWANLLFALTAVATSLLAAGEVWMMRAETPPAVWPGRALDSSTRLGAHRVAGRVRPALSARRATMARLDGLWPADTVGHSQFFHGANLNYREVTALRPIPFLGESVSVGEGVSNPWMLVGQLSLLLLVIFAADAAFTVWRRGDRRQALVVGGGIVFCVLMGTGQAILVFWGIISAPITASLFYMGIVAAMGFELSHDVLRAAELSEELRESERRMDLAASAAELGLWVWDMERDEIGTTDKGHELFGLAKTEPLNFSRIIQRLHPDDREPTRVAVATAIGNGGNYHNEYRLLSGAVSVRWIAAQGRVEFAADRRPLRMRGVSIDITARRLAEQEVQERRAELTDLSRVAMLGELSGSLAHELNQPLTAILSKRAGGPTVPGAPANQPRRVGGNPERHCGCGSACGRGHPQLAPAFEKRRGAAPTARCERSRAGSA